MMRFVLAAGLVLLASPAFAHAGAHEGTGFVAGLLHPVSGLDHLLAMIAVGLWAAQIGGRALRLLPVAFPVAMVLGALAAGWGVGVPAVEIGIAVSVLALGGVILLAAKPHVVGGMALVAAFAVLHGHAHGAEVPAAADPLAYGLGFVLTTAALHLLGVALGLVLASPRAIAAVRMVGAAIALAGIGLLPAL
jgi:urease accessory protein